MLLTTDQPRLGKSRQSFLLRVESTDAVVLCVLAYVLSDTVFVLALS